MTTPTGKDRRSGARTRADILRVALQLFTEKGFEATSIRDISEALGLTKSALYYHFRNKDEIMASLMAERRADLDALVDWINTQPRTPDLPQRAALRWMAGTTTEHLQAMRLAQANQPVMRRLAGDGKDVRSAFGAVVDLLAGEGASAADRLLIRMTFDTTRAALLAAQGTDAGPDDVIAAARRAGRALARATADEGEHEGEEQQGRDGGA
ncbi:TetR/AcrR family transcriptional regulator [Streptomyces pinistramenti]|uniref:TetR/AcrR family transcriptional regulator n=1 Tax=Streptomyces pinistramenti TaxID=2884812 RepID=UPI001D094E48|nr:TetR/AcrR family transcriptional regulator [Streptomyces pinistramenti]MCB5909157.1 TetR/AcrR family transcriptional regulator [Streptomyces pinistramenti]